MRDIHSIRRLVGDISEDQLRYVDCAVYHDIGVFIPIAGQCQYAISPCHTHPAYSFILSFDNQCQTRIGDTVITSVPSTMAMMPPDFPHQELPGDTVARYIAVMISPEFFEAQKTLYGVNTPVDASKLYSFTDRLVSTCKEFVIDYQEAFPGYEKLLESAELKICHLIIRQLLNISQKEHRIADSIMIHRAVEYIYTHLSERLTVSELAHQAHLSESHFSRLFRKELGVPPAEYLMQVRLDYARRMLCASDKSMTDIAFDCGFNSSSYFSQCFSRTFSVTPSEYRARHALSGK